KDESFLLVRHAYKEQKLSLPGGGVNEGELFWQAAVRETLEETGAHIRIERHIGIFSLRYCHAHVVLYEGVIVGASLMPKRNETSQVSFFRIEDLAPAQIYPAQLSLLMWASRPPRENGIPLEGYLTVPPTP